ncbi:PREDICTED: uncharacterized protein LOC108767920 [Trachymyrmex cornetzi]|uniref:uncharacterized protein LOC108767920 n=1 Tax=Trachymyrmex cornetzi TaxID=471704 RepID=UPI00084ED2B0|nr:PREDICTED: uncharacterized protein LOC108767920 [Trachymyrmex cornetzi]
MDVVPCEWIVYDNVIGNLNTIFMPPPYTTETAELLHALVKKRQCTDGNKTSKIAKHHIEEKSSSFQFDVGKQYATNDLTRLISSGFSMYTINTTDFSHKGIEYCTLCKEHFSSNLYWY